MAKPSITKITPFDAERDYELVFSYFGNLPYKNRLILYNGDSLEELWDDTIESFQLKHTIPAGTLRNGDKYAAQVQCFDKDGNPSALSDKVFFLTLATPTYHFEGISDGDTVETSSIAATIKYDQEQFEDIRSYSFSIYNEAKILLLTTGALYDYENMSYVFKGLNNNTTYYIRWQGVTDNGVQCDTGYVKVFVKYENPNTYARMYVDCDKETSAMHYHTNFVLIEADNDEEYEYENGFINLLGKTLSYSKDYIIPEDGTWVIRGRDLYREGEIFRMKNDKYEVILTELFVDDGEAIFKLIVPNGLCNYILYSPPIAFDEYDVLNIFIRKINNVYQLKVVPDYNATTQTNMFFGSNRPASSVAEQYDIWINTDNTPTERIDKDEIVINENYLFYQPLEPDVNEKFTVWIGDYKKEET